VELEIGAFDSVNGVFLNAEARKNLSKDRSRLSFCAPIILKVPMANLNADADSLDLE
jgi:hypothetical protein